MRTVKAILARYANRLRASVPASGILLLQILSSTPFGMIPRGVTWTRSYGACIG
jgi:hypothetical protein